jgi:hypothetical protein
VPGYLLFPLILLGILIVILGAFVLLGRFRGGRYLKPVIAVITKVPFLRRWFQKVSQAALEKQNPELASALRKMQRVGTNPDPVKAQQALSQLSASERRAYLEAVQEQGAMPEAANRQMRRQQQRLQQGIKPAGGGGKKSDGKKRR